MFTSQSQPRSLEDFYALPEEERAAIRERLDRETQPLTDDDEQSTATHNVRGHSPIRD